MNQRLSCAATDSLEAAIVLKRKLHIWLDEKHLCDVLPVDLNTKGGQEFLLIIDADNKQQIISTSHITRFEAVLNVSPKIKYPG